MCPTIANLRFRGGRPRRVETLGALTRGPPAVMDGSAWPPPYSSSAAASRTAGPTSSPTVTTSVSATPTSSPLPTHGRIAFTLEFGPTGDNCNIATVEADGTDLRMLTAVTGAGCYSDPAWSSQGDRILFDGGSGNSGHLFSIPTSGGPVRQLTSTAAAFDGDPAMSRDGTRIAFDRSGGPKPPLPGIFLMNVDGTYLVRLTTPPSRSVSGDSIARLLARWNQACLQSRWSDLRHRHRWHRVA